MRIRLLILLACLCLPFTVGADTSAPMVTTVTGEVFDAETGQPLTNVNVYLQGTQIGTSTDTEGFFFLRTGLSHKATLVVSCVGYQRQRFPLQPGQSAGIAVVLKPNAQSLSDVLVTPGENPAIALMQQVRRHRRMNERSDPSIGQQHLQVCLSDIRAKHLKRHIWRSMRQAMLAAEDSSLLLPLYARTVSGGQTSEQVALLSATDWQQLLSDFDVSPSFYHNTIPFYTATLISPLATDGGTYYRYYLADSISEGGKAYQVDFRTKNPFYPTFNGTMLIDSASYALRSIEAEVPTEVNLNYLHHLRIAQQFAPAGGDSARCYCKQGEQITVSLDFAVKGDSSHIFPSVLLMQRTAFSDTAVSVSEVLPDTFLAAIDTAAASPLFKAVSIAAYTLSTGYFPTDTYVEFGHLSELIRINHYEKVRLGFPLRTTAKLSNTVCLEAYAAYAFGDRAWKGAGYVHLNLPAARRHILSFRYADEYVPSDRTEFTRLHKENSAWCNDLNFTGHLTHFFYKGKNLHYTDVRRREFSVYTEDDWTDNIETRLNIRAGESGYGEPTREYTSQPTYRYASLGATVRIGWNEKKIDRYFQRIHVHNELPVLFLYGEAGSVEQAGIDGYNLYGKLSLMLRHTLSLGAGGRLDYTVEAGAQFGRTPYNMLHLFAGHQSYSFDAFRFTLMNTGCYAADRYVQLHADWNGRGVLFNLIPGIRYLRLRELVSFKLAYGAFSSNRLLPAAIENPYTDLRIPYIEAAVGIGNILRIGDLYSVFRLTHHADFDAPWWSLRFRLHIEP